MNAKSILSAAALVIATISTATPAFARHHNGFLANIAEAVVPGSGDVLDNLNDMGGHPVEQAAGDAVDTIIPGAGEVVTEILNRGEEPEPHVTVDDITDIVEDMSVLVDGNSGFVDEIVDML